MDKTGRNGLRVGDILTADFMQKYEFLKKKHLEILKGYTFEFSLEETEKAWFEGIKVLKGFRLVDSEYVINQNLQEGKKILAEGAQGTLLDIDFGSYPFVTSSNTICAGACTGLGIAPGTIGEVFGIVKAYCTRVGSGPFPTELLNETGENLRKKGHEFGATTGRPRRCGWLDLPALKYSIMINGVTQIILTKADVLSGFDKLMICTAYKTGGTRTEKLPFDISSEIEPVYKEFPGWNQDICKITSFNELPVELKNYISFIEQEVKVPIKVISVGPARNQIIFK
jgi:adenylosuccinate synthase